MIVRDGKVIAEGANEVTSSNDPTAHAEVVAIRRACAAVEDFSLAGATIYSSCEPCPMCLSAIYWARLDRLVYANTRDQAAAIGFDDAFLYDEVPKAPLERQMPTRHLPSPEAEATFQAWAEKIDKSQLLRSPVTQQRLWIKDPLAIFADGAERGLVVEGRIIAELVPAGAEPLAPCDVFDAGRHVVLPGLVNTHHHFYQTLTRAHPAAINKRLFPWLQALYPIWARLTPDTLRPAVRIALIELLMSGCTTAADHHYLYPEGSNRRSTSRSRLRARSASA